MRIAQALRIAVATTALTGTVLLGAQIAHADASGTPSQTGVARTTGTTGAGGVTEPADATQASPTPTPSNGNNPWD
ncbi:hypothetical protein ACH4F6_15380 [Streptomyces sp. NPDC017936]|uniref:hypothetical protein n=1 Tax=Streptomyces sp. NPDC017936 TaxID=3365016 RepID=UPI0037B7A89D